MTFSRHSPGRPRRRGFILLEVILAIALFGLVAVGLTQAIQQIGIGAHRAGEEMRLQRMLETLLTEASKAVDFEPGEVPLGEDEHGVYYVRIIEELEMYTTESETSSSRQLTQMYRIAIQAIWGEVGEEKERIAELIRYEPLYDIR